MLYVSQSKSNFSDFLNGASEMKVGESFFDAEDDVSPVPV